MHYGTGFTTGKAYLSRKAGSEAPTPPRVFNKLNQVKAKL